MKILQFRFVLACALLILSLASARTDSFSFGTIAGVATNVGSKDGTNSGALFYGPTGIALDNASNLYIADGSAIRRITPSGTNWVVTTLAGMVTQHGTTDATNSDARFDTPQGLALSSPGGGIFVADELNNAIRKITPAGTNWIVTTIAGLPGRLNHGTNDGMNTDARFYKPYGIAADGATNLYVADTHNHAIRKITPVGNNWVVTTIAGMAGTNTSGSADGTNSSARFNAPVGIALDAFTNVYVADFTNNTIRKLTLQGTNWAVTTIAGHAGLAGSADGTNATAQFFHPSGITIDGAGTVYVTDSMNNTIRKVKPFGTNWVVTTLAGSPGIIGSADGTGKSAQFYSPNGVTVDSAGKLYVADSFNATVRVGRLAILLNLTQSGNKMILSWPMGATGYLAEASSSLSGANWNPVTGTTVTDLDTYFITNTPAGPAMFYRLIKP